MKIRKVKPEDCKDIWIWRNDFSSRKMFKNNKLISWSDHLKWFSKCLKDEKCFIYIGYLSKPINIGIVRFNINQSGNSASVSLNINPEFRKLGFGTQILKKSILEFKKIHDITLIAEVFSENIPSIKCFNKSGFNQIEIKNDLLILIKN